MSYTKTVWRNNQAPAINADNLNHIEQGIESAHNQIAIDTSNIETLTTQVQGNASNIASEISARQSGDNSLQSQIDQLVAPTGEAPSPAEIENARVAASIMGGETYDTLGNAIRGQVTDLKSTLIESGIIIDSTTLVSGEYIEYLNGNATSNQYYSRTDYITVQGYLNLLVKCTFGDYAGLAFYDENKTYISGVGKGSYNYGDMIPVSVPTNAYYIRVSQLVDYTVSVQVASINEQLFVLQDQINILNEKIVFGEWERGYFIDVNGDRPQNNNYKWSGFIDVSKIRFPIHYKLTNFKNTYIAFYNSGKVCINAIQTSTSNSLETVEGVITDFGDASYIAFCTSYDGFDELNINSITDLEIANGSIISDYIAHNAIIPDKASFILHDPDTNYIYGWIDDCYINQYGKILPNDGFFLTKPVYLEPNTQYYHGHLYSGYYCFFDKDGALLEGHGFNDGSNPFTTPANTAYGMFTCVSEARLNDAWISTVNSTPPVCGYLLDDDIKVSGADPSMVTNPCDYTGDDITAFTKCLCIGDSLTSGTFNHNDSGSTQYVEYDKYSYPRNLERITGIDVTNMGLGGYSSGEWYAARASADLSGYDFAIIQLGVNDNIRRTSLGMTLAEWFADSTRCGFANIISKLKQENNNIKIFVANIIPARSYHTDSYIAFSDYLLNWVTTTYADDENVIPLDIQQYGHTYDLDAYNCGHLSAYGYNRLARDYKAYIGYYMLKNSHVFKEIQFIGTEYWYDNPINS